MFRELSDNIASFLFNQNIINKDEKEAVSYGMEYILSVVINLSVILVMAIFIDKMVETIGFLIGFFIIRSYAGGHHAKTHMHCQIESYAVYCVNMFIFYMIEKILSNFFNVTVLVSVISCILVFITAPIDHPNKRFSVKEYKYFQKRSRESVVILSLIILTGEWFCKGEETLFVSVSFGILTAALSVLIVKINKGGKAL